MRDWQAFVRARLSLSDLTPARESRIVRELAAQLEDFYRDALARGATDAEAEAHAEAQVHDWQRLAAEVRRSAGRHVRPRLDRLAARLEEASREKGAAPVILAQLLVDMRYGLRQLWKTPGFSIVAVLTLALGIGATTAVFSVVNGVVLKPLPFPEPDGVVQLLELVPQHGRFGVAPANFFDWRAQNRVFERMAAFADSTDTLIGPDGPERISMTEVSWDVFDLLRVQPAIGRGFRPEEDVPGMNPVIVLSHGLWQRRFGGDPGILGRSVTLGDAPATIVGVMPREFYFPTRETEFWRPMALDPAAPSRGAHFLDVVARLKPGVTVERAGAEMRAIAERLAAQYPENADESVETIRMHELMVGSIRETLLTLLAAVGVVVLIACANVANLLLVRASVREKEIAVRAAMGAGRRRIVLQMLAESLCLSMLGGSLGILLAYASVVPLRALSAGSIPRVADVSIDGTVLLFSLAVTMLTGVVFGLAPAWQACRTGLGDVLKEGGRSASTAGGRRLRRVLLIAEVALSIVLLVGATLLIRSFARLTSIDPGFDPEGALTFRVALPERSYPKASDRIAFYDRLLEKFAATPGIEAAGMVQQLPLRGGYFLSFSIEGRPPAAPGTEPSANHRVASPGYFAAMRIPLIRGRSLDTRDAETTPLVAVVDEAFASRYFPGEDPIGRSLRIGNGAERPYQIVGVVGDVRHGGLATRPSPTMYVPFKQDVFSGMWLVARTHGQPTGWAAAASLAVREIDPSLPAFAMMPLSDVVRESVAQRRFSMLLLALFASVALFLAAVGLYGVVAYAVSQRTQEIGLRMAVGAQPGHVLTMVLGEGMRLALVGVVIGVAGALALTDVVAALLFQITPFDLASYAATAALLLAVAALACYMPARRAMAIDPLAALRHE